MKNKLKVLSYYILMIIISVLVLTLSLFTLLKFTILDQNYLIKQLEKNNYYENLYNSITEEMSYYIVQSGLKEEVLEKIYTKEMITNSINEAINNFYTGKKIMIDTTKVKENLNNNIKDYLSKNNIIITDQKALDMFVDHIISIYNEKIILSKHIEKFQNKLIKLDKIIDTIFIILMVLISILTILCHLFYKRIILTIPCISTAILLFLGNYLLYNRIDVKNILFWNDNVSTIIKSILWSIKDFITNEAIILIISGTIFFIIGYLLTNRKIKNDF